MREAPHPQQKSRGILKPGGWVQFASAAARILLGEELGPHLSSGVRESMIGCGSAMNRRTNGTDAARLLLGCPGERASRRDWRMSSDRFGSSGSIGSSG